VRWARRGGFDYSYSLTGSSSYQSEFKSGSQFALAYGQSAGSNLRWELAISGESHDIEKATLRSGGNTYINTITGETKATALDANVYYDFPVKGRVHPYVVGGIGVTALQLNDGFLDDSTSAMRIQGMAGVSVDLSKKVGLFVEARLQHIGGVEIQANGGSSTAKTDLKISTSGVLGGLRVAF